MSGTQLLVKSTSGSGLASNSLTLLRYAPACIKLLAQYKSLMKLVGDDIGGVESFMKRFKVSNFGTNTAKRYHLPQDEEAQLTPRWTTRLHCIG
jgi:hypothetical protein